MAHDNATERINNALSILRSELTEMRNQDVQLMKQLMSMNNSVQQLTTKKKCTKRSRGSRSHRKTSRETLRATTLKRIAEDVESNSSESEYDSDTTTEDIFKASVRLLRSSLSDDNE